MSNVYSRDSDHIQLEHKVIDCRHMYFLRELIFLFKDVAMLKDDHRFMVIALDTLINNIM